MLEPKHTPGPWKAEGDCVYGNGFRIADCYCEDQESMSDVEIDANCHLISAAPDLYAALERIEYIARFPQADVYKVSDMVETARRALGKE